MGFKFNLIVILIITSILGVTGTVYFARRAGDSSDAYGQLREINRRLQNNIDNYKSVNEKYKQLNEELGRNNERLQFNNRQLQNNIIELTKELGTARRELGRLGVYIERLEGYNRQLETIFLGIADRNGFKVDRSNSR